MRRTLKRILPTTVLKQLRAAIVRRNRAVIRRKAQRLGCLLLDPDNNVEHYYHFLFDLCLPLWCVAKDIPDGRGLPCAASGF